MAEYKPPGYDPTGYQPDGYVPDDSGTAGDTTPDAFGFTPKTGQALNTLIESAPLTISGFDTQTTISVLAGAEYSVNGGAYTTADGQYEPTDTVQLRVLSSPLNGTSVTGTLVVGGVQGTFTVTTLSASVYHRVVVQVGGNRIALVNPSDGIALTLDWELELDDGVTLDSVTHVLPAPLVFDAETTESAEGLSQVKLSGAKHGAMYQIAASARLSSGESITRIIPARALNG